MAISSTVTPQIQPLPQPTALVPNNVASSGSSGLSFGDILDAVNPLQHIPVVSNLYRAVSGSQISTASQVAGDTLYGVLLPGGAVAGLASSLANVAVKEVTGKDIGQIVVGAVSSPSSNTAGATPLVASTPTAAQTAAASNAPSAPSFRVSQSTQISNNQYQRVQALDSLNQKLLKMAV